MTNLPKPFADRMHNMLGEQFDAFIASYEKARNNGLRINRLRTNSRGFMDKAPFELEPVPWINGGFFYSHEIRAAAHPYYNAGVYYIQEPSAQTPADRLLVDPGDRVLDLCAAPGGKATELAGKLAGSGLLVANEINASRVKALLHNMEVCGAANAVVTNETPQALSERFPGYFDKILVDAPCSGEGMFRKNSDAFEMWTQERVDMSASLQRSILECAVKMLKKGGLMMYSTCTFSPEENEMNMAWLVREFPEMSLQEIMPYEGFDHGHPEWADGNTGLLKTVRIWPHRMRGEGHFLALLKKEGEPEITADTRHEKVQKKGRGRSPYKLSRDEKQQLAAFFDGCVCPPDINAVENINGKAFLNAVPKEQLKGLKVIRNGLYLGEFKKDRFEPSQAFAMTLSQADYRYSVSFEPEDDAVAAYLRGEAVAAPDSEDLPEKGWILVCVDGFPLGFAKKNGAVLKNKLLYHWRT